MRSGAAVPLIVVLLLAGACARGDGLPPSSPLPTLTQAPDSTTPEPDDPATAATPDVSIYTPPSPRFADGYLQDCAGTPTARQVIAVVRTQPNLSGAAFTALSGPRCVGDWQYTVLSAPDREPLQVITRGESNALVFVTAGTDVCSVRVRAAAPVALLNAVNCDGG